MRKIACVLALLAVLASNFGCGYVPAANAQTSQQPGFTAGSKVKVEPSGGVYDIGAEALMADTHVNGLGSYNLQFTLPSNQTIINFEGTISWADSCHGDVLFALLIDGSRYYPIILKSKASDSNIFFHYTIPVSTGTGQAELHMEANPTCTGDYAGMSSAEIQAMLQVQ